MTKVFLLRCLVALAFVSCAASVTHAGTFTFSTAGASGACTGGSSVQVSGTNGSTENALATITTNNGSITVTLTNCLANPKDVTQVITDVFFTVNATGSFSLTNTSGSLINIAGDGTVTSGGAIGNPNSWALDSGTCPSACHLNDLGGGQPLDGIIGPGNTSGVYSNANGSIAGNGPHNPFLNQTGVFTITAANVTTSSTITNVDISFGTVPSAPGTNNTTPEPGTLFLFGSGLIGVAGLIRRKLAN